MSTRPDLLEHALAGDIFEDVVAEPQVTVRESGPWNPDRFGDEQIRNLVRQVFLPGWPKPARQVVFCAVEDGDVAGICLRVSQALAAQIPGNVALVEAHLPSEADDAYGMPTPAFRPAGFRPLRDSARRISSHLWRVPREMFLGGYLSDGVILVLQANSTRRAAAQRAVQTLQATNARLLGSVLNGRTFPIPEGIYRRL